MIWGKKEPSQDEPLGIYAGRAHSLPGLRDGAVVTLPNDPENSGRALLLLQSAGLLHLRTGTAVGATVQDVTDNPGHLQWRLLEAEQLPRSLDDADLAVINMNYALASKLDPVTGNGNGPLGAYLVRHGFSGIRDGRFNFRALQGRKIGRSGAVKGSVEIVNGEPLNVIIGEDAVVAFSFDLSM